MSCGCGDTPDVQQLAANSETLWLGGEALAGPRPGEDPPIARAITGSLSISTGTAIAILIILFVGLPLLNDLLGD